MIRAAIGLGSNIDSPYGQLCKAVRALHDLPKTVVCAVSPVYQSSPLGPQDQPDFLNACALLNTEVTAEECLSALQGIEQAMGRVHRRRWGERCIDLDLLFFGCESRRSERLTLPHPGLTSRDFVLAPLKDMLGGGYQIAGGQSLDALLADCTTGKLVRTELCLSTT